MSSLGKGIISSSLARLLLSRGFRVTIQKFDPYINIDPGTLNPYEHGECYVTVDGHEAAACGISVEFIFGFNTVSKETKGKTGWFFLR